METLKDMELMATRDLQPAAQPLFYNQVIQVFGFLNPTQSHVVIILLRKENTMECPDWSHIEANLQNPSNNVAQRQEK